MDVQQVTAAIAANTRAWRLRRGFSLDALAARAGVSRGMLVQVEQARTNPSIATIVRLSEALGVALVELISPVESEPVRLVPATRAAALWRGPAGGEGRLLLGADPPAQLELWEWRMEPGERHASEAHPAGARELIAVTAGTLELEVDGVRHEIATGDSALLVANRPHAYACIGTRSCRFTLVYAVASAPEEEAEVTSAPALQLAPLDGTYAISRLPADAEPPKDPGGGAVWSLTRAPGELCVLSIEDAAPAGARVEPGWRALRVAGPLSFELTGVLAALAGPLAEAGVPILAQSTYDTDLLFVRADDLARAVDVLAAHGHLVGEAAEAANQPVGRGQG
jgi:transcriptional regulator with XRE-family HTH domain